MRLESWWRLFIEGNSKHKVKVNLNYCHILKLRTNLKFKINWELKIKLIDDKIDKQNNNKKGIKLIVMLKNI